MKQQLNPVVAGVVIALIVGVVGFFIWKGTQPKSTAEGEFNFQVNPDPVKRQQQLDDLIKRDREAHGIK